MISVVAVALCVHFLLGSGAAGRAIPRDPRRAPVLPSGGVPSHTNGPRTGSVAFDELPLGARLAIERGIAATRDAFAPRHLADGQLALSVPRGGRGTVDADGMHVSLGLAEAHVRAAAIGRSASMRRLPDAEARTHGAEVVTDRGEGIEEWWRALPSGLEHGVTLHTRPAGTGALVVALEFGDSLTPTLRDGQIALLDAAGGTTSRYGDLLVVDAEGRELDARFVMEAGDVQVHVDDRHAVYPVVVDPTMFVETQILFSTLRDSGDTSFGHHVVISGDGERLACASDDRVFVFARTGFASWVLEQAVDLPRWGGAANYPNDARSLAIDDTGVRLAVGGLVNAQGPSGWVTVGTVFVYHRVASTWALEATLIGTDFVLAYAGVSVAMDADATRIVTGVDDMDTPSVANAGGVYVFVRSGSTYTLEQRLYTNDPDSGSDLGRSIAISADGTRFVVGAPAFEDGSARGAAYVFERSGTTWMQQAKLLASSLSSGARLGSAVAMSSSGSTVVATATNDASSRGAAVVYQYSNSVWGAGTIVRASDGVASDQFGASLALTDDGSSFVIGAPEDRTVTPTAMPVHGSAYAFDLVGATWAEAPKLVASDAADGDRFGAALAVDASAGVLAIGAPSATSGGHSDAGELYSFGQPHAQGAHCTANTDCASNFCVDGVCCNEACGAGSALDCRACSANLTGLADGVCSTLSASAAPSFVCRPPAGVCDLPESCVAGVATCPANVLATTAVKCATTSCTDGVIHFQQTCSGVSSQCGAQPTTSCLPYACATPATCYETCTSNAQCASGAPRCQPDGTCGPLLALGSNCLVGTDCMSGFCPSGMCSSSADAGFDGGPARDSGSGGCSCRLAQPADPASTHAAMVGAALLGALFARRRTARRTGARSVRGAPEGART